MDFLSDRCDRRRMKNLSVCKTRDPQVRPYKGRMLKSGKCKLGDRQPQESRWGWAGEVPRAAGPAGTRSSLEAQTMGFSSWTQRVGWNSGIYIYVCCQLRTGANSILLEAADTWHLLKSLWTVIVLKLCCFEAVTVCSQLSATPVQDALLVKLYQK